MSDINDIRSAWLEAKAEVEEFFEQFLKEFYKPDFDLMREMILNQPPEVLDQLRAMVPDAMAELEKGG